nr:AlpA family phage regulatory protein [Xanthomonas albilineans]
MTPCLLASVLRGQVQSGRYPQPVKLGERCTAWRVEDIRELIERTASAKAAP